MSDQKECYLEKLLKTENPSSDSKGPFNNDFTSLKSLLSHVKQYGIPFGQQCYSGTTEDGKVIAGVKTWIGNKENLQDSHTIVDANPQKHGIVYTYFKRQHLMTGFNLFCDPDSDGDGFEEEKPIKNQRPEDYVLKSGKLRNTRLVDVPLDIIQQMVEYWSDKKIEKGTPLEMDIIMAKKILG